MTEQGASDPKGGKKSAKSAAKPAAKTPRKAVKAKGPANPTSAMGDPKQKMAGNGGNRRPIRLVGLVLLGLALCCLCTLAVLWFTGDSIIEYLSTIMGL